MAANAEFSSQIQELHIENYKFSDDEYDMIRILNSLFEIQSSYRIKFIDKAEYEQNAPDNIFISRVRGRWGTIPLSSAKLKRFDSNVVGFSFEIFLSDYELDYAKAKIQMDSLGFPAEYTFRSEINKGKSKLLQFIFFDLKNLKFIGKPEDFPLEEKNYWFSSSFGDAGAFLFKVDSLENILNCDYGCVINYTEHNFSPSFRYIVILDSFPDNSKVIASKKLEEVNMGKTVFSFKSFIKRNNSIIAIKKVDTYSEYYNPMEGGNDSIIDTREEEVTIVNW